MDTTLLLDPPDETLFVGPTKRLMKNHAVLAIGVGGMGAAALETLKRQVYRTVIPEHPDVSSPAYGHIRFLAVGTEVPAPAAGSSTVHLDPASEFFSLAEADLAGLLSEGDSVRSDPTLSWMDLDGISARGLTQCRQAARALLIRRAEALKEKLHTLCTDLLTGLSRPTLDIYLFTDVCSYPSSGCFLDLCYVLRHLLAEQDWMHLCCITGVVFLPDVNAANASPNYADGYAALKELDYLMDLSGRSDCFSQNYGAFSIRTQEAPVDTCCLISAKRSDPSIFPSAPVHPIQAACDYVCACLGYARHGDSQELSLPGYLSGVSANRASRIHFHGANHIYHVIGSAKAVFPYSSILAYLSAKFQQRFSARCGGDKVSLTAQDARDWRKAAGIAPKALRDALTEGCAPLTLPSIPRRALVLCDIFSDRNTGHPWVSAGNQWMAQCRQRRARLMNTLTAPPSTGMTQGIPDDAPISRVFDSLCAKCTDPSFGPYYAAALLADPKYGLITTLSGAVAAVEAAQSGYPAFEEVEAARDCSHQFIFHPSRKNYLAYECSVKRLYLSRFRQDVYTDLLSVLRTLLDGVTQLYQFYFLPLLRLLDGWRETCAANLRLLEETPQPTLPYVQYLADVRQLRPQLDQIVDGLPPDALDDFLAHLLRAYDQHPATDDAQDGLTILGYMQSLFASHMAHLWDAALYSIDPDPLGDGLVQRTLFPLLEASKPLFWCSPSFSLFDSMETNLDGRIFLSDGFDTFQDAFTYFRRSHSDYSLHATDDKWSICVYQSIFYLPLYAYAGLSDCKACYDKADSTGLHLYAATGRGTDGAGSQDWRSFLPDPFPYSYRPDCFPEGARTLALYEQAEAEGLFSPVTDNGSYSLKITAPLSLPCYRVYDFIRDGVFQEKALDVCLEALRQAEQQFLTCPTVEQTCRLYLGYYAPCHDKKIPDRIRKDLFLSAPRFQQAVRAELDKREAFRQSMAALQAIRTEASQYEDDLIVFADLLFYQILSCSPLMGQLHYNVSISYQYTAEDGTERRLLLSQKGHAGMKYAKDYPLYQAFLTYRALSPDAPPRREMEAALRARKIVVVGKGDNVIGRLLDRQWNEDSLAALRQALSERPMEEQCDLLRFYSGLVACIHDFRAKFRPADWTDLSSLPAPVSPHKTWVVSDGNRLLYLYDGINPQFGWEPFSGQWCPITAGMYLWEPVQACWHLLTDEQGYLHISLSEPE